MFIILTVLLCVPLFIIVSGDSRFDCQAWFDAGSTTSNVYMVTVGENEPYPAYCQMTQDAGWMVMQRRVDDTVDFDVSLADYQNELVNASVDGNYWIGLDRLARITKYYYAGTYMRVEAHLCYVASVKGITYQDFKVGDASTQYTLTYGKSTPDAAPFGLGDSLSTFTMISQHISCDGPGCSQNGTKFYTKDKDNTANCSAERGGGWWFSDLCGGANLNSQFSEKLTQFCLYDRIPPNHIRWASMEINGDRYQPPKTTMLIRGAPLPVTTTNMPSTATDTDQTVTVSGTRTTTKGVEQCTCTCPVDEGFSWATTKTVWQ